MYVKRAPDWERPVSGMSSLSRAIFGTRGGFAPSRTYSARERIGVSERWYESSFDGQSSASYSGANNHDMFSPAFRHDRANCGSTKTTPAFAPWRPLTSPIRRTGRSAHAPVQTPRPQLAIKSQMLHLDIDNSKVTDRRAAIAATGMCGYGRPWSGSWSSQKQLPSRQHVCYKRYISARYSRLYNAKTVGGDSIVDLPGAPSTFANSHPSEEERQQFDGSLKHRKTPTMSRMNGINGSTQKNYVCLKLHDDISSKNIRKKKLSNPAPDDVAVGDGRTTTATTRGGDMSEQMGSCSQGTEAPLCVSPDVNRSEKSTI